MLMFESFVSLRPVQLNKNLNVKTISCYSVLYMTIMSTWLKTIQ